MFNINGEEWEVLTVPTLHYGLQRNDGTYAIGVCDDNNKIIYINNNLDEEKFKKVLSHEVTHAAMFSYNVDLSLKNEELLADLIATYGQEIIYITNKIFHRICENKNKELVYY